MSLMNDAESIKKEVKRYYVIFGSLLTLSLAAVALNYLHLPLTITVVITLLIASTQVFLAAGYFMHLISEKTIMVYLLLMVTVSLVIPLIGLPMMAHSNTITGTIFTNHGPVKEPAHAKHAENVHREEHVP